MNANRFTGERFEKALNIALGSAGLRSPDIVFRRCRHTPS